MGRRAIRTAPTLTARPAKRVWVESPAVPIAPAVGASAAAAVGTSDATGTLTVWRHPRVPAMAGLCAGRSDPPLDPRRARRLARRIHDHWRQTAAAQGAVLPPDCRPLVVTSDRLRCRRVGQALRSLGWRHRVDPALCEMDFGRWERRTWAQIGHAALQAWTDDFIDTAPGGGESVRMFLIRVASWHAPHDAVAVVGHAGWLVARRWWMMAPRRWPAAAEWPPSPGHGRGWALVRSCPDSDLLPRR